MKSFGKLLRKMRGPQSLAELAKRTTFDERYLLALEAGRQVPEEFVVRHILRRGFGLSQRDASRFVLGVQLYDLGLRDTDLRQLVIDLITKESPKKVPDQLRQIYRGYVA